MPTVVLKLFAGQGTEWKDKAATMHLIKKRMGYRVNKYASPTALSLILVETTCSVFSALKKRQKAISLQNNFI